MDANKNGTANPFADTVRTLAWITSAMDAARRHKERLYEALWSGERVERYRSVPRDAG
jgi:hypothetical protein